MRVLVTGPRTLKDDAEPAIEAALLEVTAGSPGRHTLVHGGADGGDKITARVAYRLGWVVERHRPDWTAPCRQECDHGPRRRNPYGPGTICQAAGDYRSDHMVALGAEVCVALLLRCTKPRCPNGPVPHDTHGTAHCAAKAAEAGIPVHPVRFGPAVVEQGDLFAAGEVS